MSDEYPPELGYSEPESYKPKNDGWGMYVKIAIIVLVVSLFIGLIIFVMSSIKGDNFSSADYMPSSATQTCPTHYKCGASTIDQVQLENALTARLRDTERNSETPNFGYDQVFIQPIDSEPSEAMKKRADCAKDGVFPWEGMISPYDDFEQGMMTKHTARNQMRLKK